MEILMLSPTLALPADRGDKIRIYNVLIRLAKRHRISLFALTKDERELTYQAEIAKHCVRVTTAPGGRFVIKNLPRYLLSSDPYHVEAFKSRKMDAAVRLALSQQTFDVIFCHFLYLSQYIPQGTRSVTVLDQLVCDRDMWKGRSECDRSALYRLAAKINLRRIRSYEERNYAKFDACFSVSEKDREITSQFAPPTVRLLVAPNGVDVHYFKPQQYNVLVQNNTIVICGGMNQRATVDAVLYFHREIWPVIKREVPGVRFFIVGRDPLPQIQGLNREAEVIVTGTVKDVRPYLSGSALFVAPFRLGEGTKLKVLHAMAMGKATVATSIACQGIDVTDGLDVVIADDPKAFAERVIALLRDGALRRELGRNARRLATSKYSWDTIVEGMEQEILTLVQEGKASGQAKQVIRTKDWRTSRKKSPDAVTDLEKILGERFAWIERAVNSLHDQSISTE